MTTLSLNFSSRPVRIDVEEVWLRRGLSSQQLRFALNLQAPWLLDDSPDSHAVLRLQVLVEGGTGLVMYPLGIAMLTCLVRRFPTHEDLELLMTDEQLLGLEALRGAGGLDFRFNITATIDSPEAYTGWAAEQATYGVRPARWLEILDSAGQGVTITIRVPSPLIDPQPADASPELDAPSAARAALRLRQAREHLRNGNFQDCIRTCRSVLENLAQLQPPTTRADLKSVNPQERTQEQRWSALFHDIHSLTSGASHDDPTTQDFRWSRNDAQAALAITASLLARVPMG